VPSRGEIWLFEPDPTVGREQSGIRPGVIVSIDEINQGPRNLVVAVPLTTQERPGADFPYHVRLAPEVTGLNRVSYAMCEQVRAVATDRVYGSRPRGRVDRFALLEIEDRLRIILDL
jgi:mRNA interferase MazF